MKRILSIAVAAMLILSLAACGGGKDKGGNGNAGSSNGSLNSGSKDSSSQTFKLGDYVVEYKGACLMKDMDGEDAVVVTMDFTNNSKETAAYFLCVWEQAHQGDERLTDAVVLINEDYEQVNSAQMEDVQPGATLEVRSAYVLADQSDPVVFSLESIDNDDKGEFTIDLADLFYEDSYTDDGGDWDDWGDWGDADEEVLDWWNGDWYGWWLISNGTDEYAEFDGNMIDVCAEIDIDSANVGTLLAWNLGDAKDDPVCNVDISFDAYGGAYYGTVSSEDGWFLDSTVGYGDWGIDPGQSRYDDMIEFTGEYEDEAGSFTYTFCLRPWGTEWDDVESYEEDLLPFNYDSWYRPLIQGGEDMPEYAAAG